MIAIHTNADEGDVKTMLDTRVVFRNEQTQNESRLHTEREN